MQVLNSKISKPAISKTLMKETFFLKESMSVSFYSSAQFWMFSRQHEQYHRQSWQQQDRWSPRRYTQLWPLAFSLLQNTTATQYEYCFNIKLLFGCMNVLWEKWMLILWKVSHKSIFFIKAWAFMLYGTMETLFNKIIRSWQSTNNSIFSVLFWTGASSVTRSRLGQSTGTGSGNLSNTMTPSKMLLRLRHLNSPVPR